MRKSRAPSLTPGFFPRRQNARLSHQRLAKKVAITLAAGQALPVTRLQRKVFKVMKRKVAGAHAIDWLRNGPVQGQPAPSPILMWLLRRRIDKLGVSDEHRNRLSGLIRFELEWWRRRGWLAARSYRDLVKLSAPADFDMHRGRLHHSSRTDSARLLGAAPISSGT